MNTSKVEKEVFEQNKKDEKKRQEQELLKQALQGNLEAFSKLVNPYYSILLSYAIKYRGDIDSVEDVVAEVLHQAWKNLSKYNSDFSFCSWLLMQTRTRAIDNLRKEKSQFRMKDKLENESYVYPHLVVASMYEATGGEAFQLVEKIIEDEVIQPHHKVWVRLYLFDGLSQRDIGRRTGRALGTVKTGLQLALKKIRQHLPDEYHLQQTAN